MSEFGIIAPPDPRYLIIPHAVHTLNRFEATHSLDASDSELVEEFKNVLDTWRLSQGGLIFKDSSIKDWHIKWVDALKRAEIVLEDPHAQSSYNTLLVQVNNPPYVHHTNDEDINNALDHVVGSSVWDNEIKGALSHGRGETSVQRIKPAVEITLTEGEEYSVGRPAATIRWVWQQGATLDKDAVVTRFQIGRRTYSIPNTFPAKPTQEMSVDAFARIRRGVIFSAEYKA